ncbi:hypothetical protein [Terricaulis silvestris]|uniref:hypothetical protein n=1 Tax=Terricaulis silvestris TaxID=2686094 RepID=UPI00131DB630|nr:hypothetical protein [Terricaulis silvestris]
MSSSMRMPKALDQERILDGVEPRQGQRDVDILGQIAAGGAVDADDVLQRAVGDVVDERCNARFVDDDNAARIIESIDAKRGPRLRARFIPASSARADKAPACCASGPMARLDQGRIKRRNHPRPPFFFVFGFGVERLFVLNGVVGVDRVVRVEGLFVLNFGVERFFEFDVRVVGFFDLGLVLRVDRVVGVERVFDVNVRLHFAIDLIAGRVIVVEGFFGVERSFRFDLVVSISVCFPC